MQIDQITSRLMFLMRKLNHRLYPSGLLNPRSPQDLKAAFSAMGVDIYELPTGTELPINMRMDSPPGVTYDSVECFFEDMEKRLEGIHHRKHRSMKSHIGIQHYQSRRFRIMVPQSHVHASHQMAFYVIETLLYDVLHMIVGHGWLPKDTEHLATRLSHIAIFGDDANKFLSNVQHHSPGAENILEAMGRLHDDKKYDIPLAKVLTHMASMDACLCSHVHYKVDPEAKLDKHKIVPIQQYDFGVGNSLKSGQQNTIKNFLASPFACMDYNRWNQRGGTIVGSSPD